MIEIWRSSLGYGESAPQWLVAGTGLLMIYAFVIFPSGIVIGYLDRKLGADFQARVGPNRAGPGGFFQSFADLIKLLQKKRTFEISFPEKVWIAVHTAALYSTVAALPLGTSALLMNTDMSAFFPFWVTLVLAMATLFLGQSQKSVIGTLSGMRVAAQALAGAVPALVSILCVGIEAGGFSWERIGASQGVSPLEWTALSNPFQFAAFVIFVVSGLVLLSIPPMNNALASMELHGGISANLEGTRLSLFRFGRFYSLFLWSILSAVMFLGGWNIPASLLASLKESGDLHILQLLELSWLTLKAFGIMLVVIWVSRVSPRGRVDHVTDFSWRVLGPISLFSLVGASVWKVWVSL